MTPQEKQAMSADRLSEEVWEDESPAAVRGQAPSAPQTPRQHIPIGLSTAGTRTERDSMGEVQVPADRYWGAQTQRALEHFAIGRERMPIELIHAYALVKYAAVLTNADLGSMPSWKARAIGTACLEVSSGDLDDHFPLGVFQTGSGTHTNVNLNEVIANRASQLLGGGVGTGSLVHPSDDVNMSQSTNDTFVTAMHVAAIMVLHDVTLPSLSHLRSELEAKATAWATVRKPGRTHLMDATTLTVGQEWSGYAAALDAARRHVIGSVHDLYEVALGGTAVGTGLNAPPGFAERATEVLARVTGRPFRTATNPFSAQSTVDALVRSHAALKATAATLFKIANDLRWLGSGPRHGIGELVIPENEAGSSIMPGKVNPTQAEATLMACLQVMGNDTVVTMAGAEGNFELNAFRPVVANNYLHSATILGNASLRLSTFLVHDVELAEDLVEGGTGLDGVTFTTALAAEVGYDRAARIARSATRHHRDVVEEATRDGIPESVITSVLEQVG